jgi:hypothetical protein
MRAESRSKCLGGSEKGADGGHLKITNEGSRQTSAHCPE